MEVIEKYANLIERQEKITLREGQGLRMLHDNFSADWKVGDEPHGIMTFTDEPSLTISAEPVRNLALEVDELKIRLGKLESSIIVS